MMEADGASDLRACQTCAHTVRREYKHVQRMKAALLWLHTCARMHDSAAQLEQRHAPGRPTTFALPEHIERRVLVYLTTS